MENSGEKAIPFPNPKRKPSIVNTRRRVQDASSAPSNRPDAMQIPEPKGEGTPSEQNLQKFLDRHHIGIRAWRSCPKITDVITRAIGSRQRAIETLKFSSDESAQRLLAFCERLAWGTRETIPLEALCLAAGVSITTIAGALVMAARDVSRMHSALITLREHPSVVEATAKFARKSAANSKDREMMHKMAIVGALPTPKGSNINLNFGAGQSQDEDGEDGAPSLEGVFGQDPMEIENWGEHRRKLLEAGK